VLFVGINYAVKSLKQILLLLFGYRPSKVTYRNCCRIIFLIFVMGDDYPVWSRRVLTYAFIYNPLSRAGLSSREKSSRKMNADGSVDIYFGPKAPAGLESNWIPTTGHVPVPVMRFYGPTEPFWNNTFKLPGVVAVN
jgi:hypothetical protein